MAGLTLAMGASRATAQGTSAAAIVGIVKDGSGAVRNGVRIEAASATLIERARSAVTDQHGEYRIAELRPGTYTVTFSLGGFATLTSAGIELTSNFTATVDAELKVKTGCLPCWTDLNPRLAAAFYVFGTGKTAIKLGMGRYVEAVEGRYATAFGSANAIVHSTTRSWTDQSGDVFPNCDLNNPAANGECGPMSNAAFGQLQYNMVPDPYWIRGFGKRGYNWQLPLPASVFC